MTDLTSYAALSATQRGDELPVDDIPGYEDASNEVKLLLAAGIAGLQKQAGYVPPKLTIHQRINIRSCMYKHNIPALVREFIPRVDAVNWRSSARRIESISGGVYVYDKGGLVEARQQIDTFRWFMHAVDSRCLVQITVYEMRQDLEYDQF